MMDHKSRILILPSDFDDFKSNEKWTLAKVYIPFLNCLNISRPSHFLSTVDSTTTWWAPPHVNNLLDRFFAFSYSGSFSARYISLTDFASGIESYGKQVKKKNSQWSTFNTWNQMASTPHSRDPSRHSWMSPRAYWRWSNNWRMWDPPYLACI